MSKTALIVDDSAVARHVLSNLLSEHGIIPDTAPSAEEALEYLKHRRPDAVFMDHRMPGMDGFEALEAIKANPATATIPVMMYTSQEGELYVSQARALGAFGVLPKDLRPTQVAQVLQALKLVPPKPESALAPEAMTDTADSQRVEALLEALFYQQRAALREEIREGYQRVIETSQEPTMSAIRVQPNPGKWSRRAAVALFGLALLFGGLYAATSRLLEGERQRSMELVERNRQLSDSVAVAAHIVPADPETSSGAETALAALEWAVNLAGQYPFGESPLNDQRAEQLRQLIDHLDDLGFEGDIALEVHTGQFCMDLNEQGTWSLAPNGEPAASCAQLGWSAPEAEDMIRRQSIGFANLLATTARDDGRRIQIVFQGDSQPALPYPASASLVSAGEWNSIAAFNQRIEIGFLE